ncbi:MAG: hypothetical protein O7D91_00130, partial [Planctomycetota bacterium]|nr:hypothetical protein [Planctomycetota bacterium]
MMLGGLTTGHKVIGAVLVILAVAGWIAAFLVFNKTNEMESELAAVESDRAKIAGRFSAIREQLIAAQDKLEETESAAGSLDEIRKQRDAARAEFVATKAKLGSLSQELDSTTAESAALASRLGAARDEYDSLAARIDEAKSELDDPLNAVERMSQQRSSAAVAGARSPEAQPPSQPAEATTHTATVPKEQPAAPAAPASQLAAVPKEEPMAKAS